MLLLDRVALGLQLAQRYRPRPACPRDLQTRKRDAAWLTRELSARGPVLIKIGQFVSSRGDVIDPVLVEALTALQDRVPPMPRGDLERMLDTNSSGDAFTYEAEPVASASIGQVHVGILSSSGASVAIKVRRPDIAAVIVREVASFRWALSAVENVARILRDREALVSLSATRQMLADFLEVMLVECDYASEAANMALYHALPHRATQRDWVSPRAIPSLCTESRIVMEHLPSVRLDAIVPRLGLRDRTALAAQVMDLFVSHMLLDRVVHADLQPGNIGVDTRGRLVLYDFGNVLVLPDALLRSLESLLVPLMNRDVDATVEALRHVEVVKIRDEVALKRYIELFLSYVRSVDVRAMSVSAIDVAALRSSKLPVEVDGVVFRLLRAFALVEGLCKSIDHTFTYTSVIEKFAMRNDDDRLFRAKAKADLGQLLAAATRLVEGL